MLLILPRRRKWFVPLTGGLTNYHNVTLPRRLLAAMHIKNMSISAHRVIVLEYAEYPSFKCGSETDLLIEDKDTHDGRNENGTGIVEVAVERLQEAMESSELKLDKETRDNIQADIAWAKQKGLDHVMYDLF